MKVKLRFVGLLARKAGGGKKEFELPDSVTLAEALKRIFEVYKLGGLNANVKEVSAGYLRIYVNGRVVRMDAILQEGDEISFLPPIAGG